MPQADHFLNGTALKYQNADDLQKAIDNYFITEPKEEWTITGFARSIGLTMQGLTEYQSKDVLGVLVTSARAKVAEQWEKRLIKTGRAGDIFALKNLGWKDRQELTGANGSQLVPTPILANLIRDEQPPVNG